MVPALKETDRAYGTKKYWDDRYSADPDTQHHIDVHGGSGDKGEGLTDEWLLSYADVEPLLTAALQRTGAGKDCSVLDVGCGNSKLLADMRTAGHTGILVGIEISGLGVARAACTGKDIKVVEADARYCCTDGTFAAGSFDLVIDKSTVDAMLCDAAEGMQNVELYAQQAGALLTPGGCFFLISHNSPAGSGSGSYCSGDGSGDDDDEEIELLDLEDVPATKSSTNPTIGLGFQEEEMLVGGMVRPKRQAERGPATAKQLGFNVPDDWMDDEDDE